MRKFLALAAAAAVLAGAAVYLQIRVRREKF